MGGTIDEQVDASNLPDQISFRDDENLVISADGVLRMSFDKIVNTGSNESIVTYISNQLFNSTSEIMQQVQNDISTAVSGIYNNSSHHHYIGQNLLIWNRPDPADVDLTTLDGQTTYQDIPLNQIDMIARYNNQDYRLNLDSFLRYIGYYSNIYYGNIDTSDSLI